MRLPFGWGQTLPENAVLFETRKRLLKPGQQRLPCLMKLCGGGFRFTETLIFPFHHLQHLFANGNVSSQVPGHFRGVHREAEIVAVGRALVTPVCWARICQLINSVRHFAISNTVFRLGLGLESSSFFRLTMRS